MFKIKPMKFQLFFISIVLCLVQNSTAQDFKTDWNAFTSRKYTLDFTTNSTTYYGTDTVGEMHCKLNAEPSNFIVYFVFQRNKTMEEFRNLFNKNEELYNCVNLSKIETSELYYEQFAYLLSPWQPCDVVNDSAFNDLSKELLEFIISK